jgi:hypothetical protein
MNFRSHLSKEVGLDRSLLLPLLVVSFRLISRVWALAGRSSDQIRTAFRSEAAQRSNHFPDGFAVRTMPSVSKLG